MHAGRIVGGIAVALLCAIAPIACAQGWPAKPVRMVVVLPLMPVPFGLLLGDADAAKPRQFLVLPGELPVLKLRVERDPHVGKLPIILRARPKRLRHFEVVAVFDVQDRVRHDLCSLRSRALLAGIFCGRYKPQGQPGLNR